LAEEAIKAIEAQKGSETALLWAASELPGVLDVKRKQELIEMIFQHQRPDGGWSIRTIALPEHRTGLVLQRSSIDPIRSMPTLLINTSIAPPCLCSSPGPPAIRS
jgi:hypothetical protein